MSISLNNITKSYDNESVLSNFSYTFENSGIYIIKGNSGIGKTTLLRLISGLDTDYSGTISGAGIESISYMFQEYRLFPTLSAYENAVISISDDDTILRTRAKDVLVSLGFTDDDLRKKPSRLSGGMKQRVAFARALVHKSPILLLDEPTKELNREIIDIMSDILIKESKDRLIIIVTHDDFSGLIPEARIINL